VGFGKYSFYSIRLSTEQLATLSFSKLRIKVVAYSGRVDLFASVTAVNPKYSQSALSSGEVIMSTSKQRLNVLEFSLDPATPIDEYFRLYVGVYGA
jgi:hypothetical protein